MRRMFMDGIFANMSMQDYGLHSCCAALILEPLFWMAEQFCECLEEKLAICQTPKLSVPSFLKWSDIRRASQKWLQGLNYLTLRGNCCILIAKPTQMSRPNDYWLDELYNRFLSQMSYDVFDNRKSPHERLIGAYSYLVKLLREDRFLRFGWAFADWDRQGANNRIEGGTDAGFEKCPVTTAGFLLWDE